MLAARAEVSEAAAQEFSCCCHAVCGLYAELLGGEWPVSAGHDVHEEVDDGVTFCGLVSDEVGYLVVEDVEVSDGLCNVFSPHPSPLPWGEGTFDGGFVAALPLWIPACAGKTARGGFAFGVGETVLDEVLCCFHSMADFDAGCFAAHGVCEEDGDVVAVFGDAGDVLL